MEKKYSIDVIYDKTPILNEEYKDGYYKTGIPCDESGYVYAVNSEGVKYQKERIMYNPITLLYSDGTPCDKDGYVYDVDEDGCKYKLFTPILINQCDKTIVNLQIKLDGNDKNPSYFLTYVDENITYKKKWDSLEIYLTRNKSQEPRELSFVINHNMDAQIKQKVTLQQSGDVCLLGFIENSEYIGEQLDEIGNVIYYTIDTNEQKLYWDEFENGYIYDTLRDLRKDNVISLDRDNNEIYTTNINFSKRTEDLKIGVYKNNYIPHLTINQVPKGEKEYYNIQYNVYGNTRKTFIKNIEQYILLSKSENIKMYDVITIDNEQVEFIFNLNFENEDETYCTGEITEKLSKYTLDKYKLYTGVRSKYTDDEVLTDDEKNFFKNYYIEDIINDAINKIPYEELIPKKDENGDIKRDKNGNVEYEKNNNGTENLLPSISTIFSSATENQKYNYQLQQVLREYNENGGFPVYKDETIINYNRRIFYDKFGEAVTINVVKSEVMNGKQISDVYSYETKYLQKTVEYVEQIEYDKGLNCKVENSGKNENTLTIENYGRLFLEGKNSFYKIIIAHQNDFSKTLELYIRYNNIVKKANITTDSNDNLIIKTYDLKTLKNRVNIIPLEIMEVPYTNGYKNFYIQRSYSDIIGVNFEYRCDWLTYKIIDDNVYISYKDNTFNYERSNIVTITKNNQEYKKFELKQLPFNDYKIEVDYDYFNLKHNEEPFKLRINVYGGNKKIFIDDTNLPYKYKLELYYENIFFNTYNLMIQPTYNSSHKIILSNILLIHEDNDSINKKIEFEQNLNINTIEYTILCDNVIMLQPYSTKYLLEVETYPFNDSSISCECRASWVKYKINGHKIYLEFKPNLFKQKSTILKITNNEFPFKQRFVKIIQKGVRK